MASAPPKKKLCPATAIVESQGTFPRSLAKFLLSWDFIGCKDCHISVDSSAHLRVIDLDTLLPFLFSFFFLFLPIIQTLLNTHPS